jgi:MerR family transcriptional regulator, copper efflux regulator
MFTIGKIARRAGVSTSAIRYYERQDLIRSSRLVNGYRVYDEDAIKTLRFVRQAQTLGITLREIKQLLEVIRDGRRPCKAVRQLAYQHLTEIETKIRELRSLRLTLRNLLSDRATAVSDELCPLILSAANRATTQKLE